MCIRDRVNTMENKTILYLLCFLILSTSSCSVKKAVKLKTPFVTVVKLIDAEQALHFEEAMQYIDVEQVYSKLGSENPIEDWKTLIRFNNNLGKDKKFSNNFGYYNYNKMCIRDSFQAVYNFVFTLLTRGILLPSL